MGAGVCRLNNDGSLPRQQMRHQSVKVTGMSYGRCAHALRSMQVRGRGNKIVLVNLLHRLFSGLYRLKPAI